MSLIRKAFQAFCDKALDQTVIANRCFDDLVLSGRITDAMVNSEALFDCPEIKELDRMSKKPFHQQTRERFQAIKAPILDLKTSQPLEDNTSDAAQHSKFELFEYLPQELRETIYEHLVPYDGITYFPSVVFSPRPKSTSNSSTPPMQYGMALLNKQYSAEFLGYVYRKVIFHFEVMSLHTIAVRLHYPISVSVRTKIRQCKFVVESSSKSFWCRRGGRCALFIPYLIQDFPNLREMRAGVRYYSGTPVDLTIVRDSVGNLVDDHRIDVAAIMDRTKSGHYDL